MSAFPPLPVDEIARNDDVLEALSWLCTISDQTINDLHSYSFDVRTHGMGLATSFYHLATIARVVKDTYASVERDREHHEEHTHSLSTVSSNEERYLEMERDLSEVNSGFDAPVDDDNVNPFDDSEDIKPFIHLTGDAALEEREEMPQEEQEEVYDEPYEEEDPPPAPSHEEEEEEEGEEEGEVPPPLPPKDFNNVCNVNVKQEYVTQPPQDLNDVSHITVKQEYVNVVHQLPLDDVDFVVDVEEEAEIDEIVVSVNNPESSSGRTSRKRKRSKERDGEDGANKVEKKKKKRGAKKKDIVWKDDKKKKEKDEEEKKREREEEKKKKEKEVVERRPRRRSYSPTHRSPRRGVSPVVEMLKPTEGQESCAFCRSFAHSSLHCPEHTDFTSRDKMRMFRKLCWHCLGPYDPDVCRQKSHMKRCTYCKFNHLSHPAMCKSYNARSPLRKSPLRRSPLRRARTPDGRERRGENRERGLERRGEIGEDRQRREETRRDDDLIARRKR